MKPNCAPRIFRSVAFLLALAIAPPAGAEEIQPPDVYALVAELADEVELLRSEMGVAKFSNDGFVVSNACPREVYYQAATVVERAQRLAAEQIGLRTTSIEMSQSKPRTPADVHQLTQRSIDTIRKISRTFGITAHTSAHKPDPSKTPSDVYNATLMVGRQISLMVHDRHSPDDVYAKVEIANRRVAGLLRLESGRTVVIEEPELARKKRPSDVYLALLKAFDVIERIADRAGVQTLTVNATAVEAEDINPSEVFELATLIVSELDFLNAKRGAISPPISHKYSTTRR